MNASRKTLGLVVCASGGAEHVRVKLVEPLMARGWRVAVTLTPTAGTWLAANGEAALLESLTGFPVRVTGRLPEEVSGICQPV